MISHYHYQVFVAITFGKRGLKVFMTGKAPKSHTVTLARKLRLTHTTPGAMVTSAILVRGSSSMQCTSILCLTVLQARWAISPDPEFSERGEKTDLDYASDAENLLQLLLQGLQDKKKPILDLFRQWDEAIFPATKDAGLWNIKEIPAQDSRAADLEDALAAMEAASDISEDDDYAVGGGVLPGSDDDGGDATVGVGVGADGNDDGGQASRPASEDGDRDYRQTNPGEGPEEHDNTRNSEGERSNNGGSVLVDGAESRELRDDHGKGIGGEIRHGAIRDEERSDRSDLDDGVNRVIRRGGGGDGGGDGGDGGTGGGGRERNRDEARQRERVTRQSVTDKTAGKAGIGQRNGGASGNRRGRG